jgi:putative protease
MEKQVGRVTNFFGKAGVAAVELEDELKVGDTIHFKGHTSDWTQKVESLQIEHDMVNKAGPGDVIGIKSEGHAREHDVVYKVMEE